MRNAFADELLHAAQTNPNIVMLSGDIGNRLFDKYKQQFPDRFYNCGVAEANMTSIAAGLALSGMRPITYTIASFNTTRCLEQIKFDIAYAKLPVVIVGVGAGLSYASLNASHHSIEDIACLRAIPNLTILCPCDAHEVRSALNAALEHDGPTYIRLGKKNEPQVHDTQPSFNIGESITVKQGTQICILATGTILPEALAAANTLEQEGISVQVVSFHTVKPLDTNCLKNVFKQFNVILAIEEHNMNGGMSSAVSEWLTDTSSLTSYNKFIRMGIDDTFMYSAGEQEFARQHYGLTETDIIDKIRPELWRVR